MAVPPSLGPLGVRRVSQFAHRGRKLGICPCATTPAVGQKHTLQTRPGTGVYIYAAGGPESQKKKWPPSLSRSTDNNITADGCNFARHSFPVPRQHKDFRTQIHVQTDSTVHTTHSTCIIHPPTCAVSGGSVVTPNQPARNERDVPRLTALGQTLL